jgi:hypothetical protein
MEEYLRVQDSGPTKSSRLLGRAAILTSIAKRPYDTLPLRKQAAGAESQARGRNDRIPIVRRLFHAFLVSDAFADGLTGIVDAVYDDRPSAILSSFDDIHLGVATLEQRSRQRGIAAADPVRCGIPSSDRSLQRDKWL